MFSLVVEYSDKSIDLCKAPTKYAFNITLHNPLSIIHIRKKLFSLFYRTLKENRTTFIELLENEKKNFCNKYFLLSRFYIKKIKQSLKGVPQCDFYCLSFVCTKHVLCKSPMRENM